MKKLFVISIVLVFSFVSCVDTSAQSLTHHSIEGIWSTRPNVTEIGEAGFHRFNLSWGRRGFPRIVDIVVDLHSDPPIIQVPELFIGDVTNIIESGSRTELTFFWHRWEVYSTVIFHFNEDGTMWIEPPADGNTLFPTGLTLHKIDGPIRED